MRSASTRLQTPLGSLEFFAEFCSESLTEKEVSIQLGPITPKLPDGMNVDSSHGVLLRVQHQNEISSLSFFCKWEQSSQLGVRESGEGLDAQSWESKDSIVMIGTEDDEFLNSRLSAFRLNSEEEMVEYLPDGFVISIGRIPPHKPVSLHYVVATNSVPEPEECSAWFAVDVQHPRVIETMKG